MKHDLDKLRAAITYEREAARRYVICHAEGRYAGQPEKLHQWRLRRHATLIADAMAALSRAQIELRALEAA